MKGREEIKERRRRRRRMVKREKFVGGKDGRLKGKRMDMETENAGELIRGREMLIVNPDVYK